MQNSKIGGIVVALIIGVISGYLITTVPISTGKDASYKSVMNQTHSTPLKTDEEKIVNAMSAAPVSIAKEATILDWPLKETDSFQTLRSGTNEWTCIPDYPSTPGNDPICVDKTAMQWFQAYLEHKTPKLAQDGLAYMLQGGSDPSNTDPYATEPKPGDTWMSAPPHVMIFPSQKLDTKIYSIDPNSGKPWIMYAGTPYEHIMMPVK